VDIEIVSSQRIHRIIHKNKLKKYNLTLPKQVIIKQLHNLYITGKHLHALHRVLFSQYYNYNIFPMR
jgi:hypothetical protein